MSVYSSESVFDILVEIFVLFFVLLLCTDKLAEIDHFRPVLLFCLSVLHDCVFMT